MNWKFQTYQAATQREEEIHPFWKSYCFPLENLNMVTEYNGLLPHFPFFLQAYNRTNVLW